MAIEKKHYSLLCAICASLFCTPLMVAGVNAILPEIGASLAASATQLSLVGAVYSLGLAIFQLSCGSLGDICGHKRLFLAGAVIFGISGAMLGFAGSMPLFLLLRFSQGIGGAMLSASGLALLASGASPENRPAYLGFSGAAVYAGIAFGPPMAGLVTASLGWRWLFWINSFACLIIFMLMKFAVSHEWRPAKGKKYDWPGCMLYGVAMAALTLCAGRMGNDRPMALIALGIFAVFIILFCLRENSCAFPILNLGLLRKNRVLALSSLAAFVNYASFFGLVFYYSFYLQTGKGFGVRETGLILAIQPLAQAFATPVATRLCKVWSKGTVCALGALLCGIGLIAAALIRLDSSLYPLFAAQILLGGGISLFALANTTIILESAGRQFVGQASALTGAVRTAGQLCSMILITMTLALFLGGEPIGAATMAGFMQSMRLNLIFLGALNLCAVALVLARNKS